MNIPTAPGGRLSFDDASMSATRTEMRSPVQEAMFTDTSLVASEPQPTRRASRRTSLVGVAGAALVAVAIAGGVALLRRDASNPPATVTLPATATAAAVASGAGAGTVTASGPSPQSSSDTPPSTPVVSPTDLPVAPRVAPTLRPGHVRHSPIVPAPPGTVSCNPPYTIDANGYKKYKRECANW